MVFDHLIVSKDTLLQFNDFGIILEQVVSNKESAIEIHHLRNMQFAMSRLV